VHVVILDLLPFSTHHLKQFQRKLLWFFVGMPVIEIWTITCFASIIELTKYSAGIWPLLQLR